MQFVEIRGLFVNLGVKIRAIREIRGLFEFGEKSRAIREIRGLFRFEDKKFVQFVKFRLASLGLRDKKFVPFVKFVASLSLGIKIRAIREIRGLFEFGDKKFSAIREIRGPLRTWGQKFVPTT